MAIKVTFTIDDETVAKLGQAAERIKKPKSYVVREAIRDFADRVGNLSERERRRMLEIFDNVVPAIPKRPGSEVLSEQKQVRDDRQRRRRRTSTPDRP